MRRRWMGLVVILVWCVATSSLAAIQATVTWTDEVTNEEEYRVERSEDGGAFVSVVTLPANDETQTPSMTYSETSLVLGVNYCYRLAVKNQFEEKAFDAGCAFPGVLGSPKNFQVIITQVPDN